MNYSERNMKNKKVRMSEKALQIKVENFLKAHNIYFIKVWGGGFQRAGVPDIIFCLNGRFWAAELKTDVGRTTELQEYNLDKIRMSGGASGVLRPSNFADFKKQVLEELSNGYQSI